MFSLLHPLDLPPDSLLTSAESMATTKELTLSIAMLFIICVLLYRYRRALHKVWNGG